MDFDNFTMPMQFKYSFVCHLWSTFSKSLAPKAMDTEIEKQKRKPRKIIKRKSLRRGRLNHVEEVTAKVGGLRVIEADAGADVIEATRSQPQSRRASSVLMPAEVSRRASSSNTAITETIEDMGLKHVTRRGSKRLSITCSDQEGLEAKKLKAALEGLGVSTKQKQKEFTWDVKTDGDQVESGVKNVSKSKRGKGAISSDDALAILGFTNIAGKVSKPRHISEYTEDEVLTAFQTQCRTLSILQNIKCKTKHPYCIFSAKDGNFGKLQDCHEAYQVLLKIIKVLSENLSIFNPFINFGQNVKC